MHFEGDRDFPQSPADLWAKVSDLRFLSSCVPGSENASFPDEGSARCTLRPGFAFVRGTLELTMRLTDLVPPSSGKLLLHTKGIGSTSQVETTFHLLPHGAGTRVHWTADVKELGGLLKAVPQGLLQAAAQKVIADAWAALDAKLQEGK